MKMQQATNYQSYERERKPFLVAHYPFLKLEQINAKLRLEWKKIGRNSASSTPKDKKQSKNSSATPKTKSKRSNKKEKVKQIELFSCSPVSSPPDERFIESDFSDGNESPYQRNKFKMYELNQSFNKQPPSKYDDDDQSFSIDKSQKTSVKLHQHFDTLCRTSNATTNTNTNKGTVRSFSGRVFNLEHPVPIIQFDDEGADKVENSRCSILKTQSCRSSSSSWRLENEASGSKVRFSHLPPRRHSLNNDSWKKKHNNKLFDFDDNIDGIDNNREDTVELFKKKIVEVDERVKRASVSNREKEDRFEFRRSSSSHHRSPTTPAVYDFDEGNDDDDERFESRSSVTGVSSDSGVHYDEEEGSCTEMFKWSQQQQRVRRRRTTTNTTPVSQKRRLLSSFQNEKKKLYCNKTQRPDNRNDDDDFDTRKNNNKDNQKLKTTNSNNLTVKESGRKQKTRISPATGSKKGRSFISRSGDGNLSASIDNDSDSPSLTGRRLSRRLQGLRSEDTIKFDDDEETARNNRKLDFNSKSKGNELFAATARVGVRGRKKASVLSSGAGAEKEKKFPANVLRKRIDFVKADVDNERFRYTAGGSDGDNDKVSPSLGSSGLRSGFSDKGVLSFHSHATVKGALVARRNDNYSDDDDKGDDNGDDDAGNGNDRSFYSDDENAALIVRQDDDIEDQDDIISGRGDITTDKEKRECKEEKKKGKETGYASTSSSFNHYTRSSKDKKGQVCEERRVTLKKDEKLKERQRSEKEDGYKINANNRNTNSPSNLNNYPIRASPSSTTSKMGRKRRSRGKMENSKSKMHDYYDYNKDDDEENELGKREKERRQTDKTKITTPTTTVLTTAATVMKVQSKTKRKKRKLSNSNSSVQKSVSDGLLGVVSNENQNETSVDRVVETRSKGKSISSVEIMKKGKAGLYSNSNRMFKRETTATTITKDRCHDHVPFQWDGDEDDKVISEKEEEQEREEDDVLSEEERIGEEYKEEEQEHEDRTMSRTKISYEINTKRDGLRRIHDTQEDNRREEDEESDEDKEIDNAEKDKEGEEDLDAEMDDKEEDAEVDNASRDSQECDRLEDRQRCMFEDNTKNRRRESSTKEKKKNINESEEEDTERDNRRCRKDFDESRKMDHCGKFIHENIKTKTDGESEVGVLSNWKDDDNENIDENEVDREMNRILSRCRDLERRNRKLISGDAMGNEDDDDEEEEEDENEEDREMNRILSRCRDLERRNRKLISGDAMGNEEDEEEEGEEDFEEKDEDEDEEEEEEDDDEEEKEEEEEEDDDEEEKEEEEEEDDDKEEKEEEEDDDEEEKEEDEDFFTSKIACQTQAVLNGALRRIRAMQSSPSNIVEEVTTSCRYKNKDFSATQQDLIASSPNLDESDSDCDSESEMKNKNSRLQLCRRASKRLHFDDVDGGINYADVDVEMMQQPCYPLPPPPPPHGIVGKFGRSRTTTTMATKNNAGVTTTTNTTMQTSYNENYNDDDRFSLTQLFQDVGTTTSTIITTAAACARSKKQRQATPLGGTARRLFQSAEVQSLSNFGSLFEDEDAFA